MAYEENVFAVYIRTYIHENTYCEILAFTSNE